MKYLILLFIIAISFIYTPTMAQVEKEDSCVCGVKYIDTYPDNYHNPILINSATYCDTLYKIIGHPPGVITKDIGDSSSVYLIDVYFQVSKQGKVEALKLSPYLDPGSLELYIEDRLPQIVSLMSWKPAYYSRKHNKKELVTAEITFKLQYNAQGIIAAMFFNNFHEELYRWEW
jgi:hypothetical protein